MSQSRTLTCVYCGHEYPQDTPAWGDKVLTDHIAKCDRHPMRKVILERDLLRAALVGLVGCEDCDTLSGLSEMKSLIHQATPENPADKRVALVAIDALLSTCTEPMTPDAPVTP